MRGQNKAQSEFLPIALALTLAAGATAATGDVTGTVADGSKQIVAGAMVSR